MSGDEDPAADEGRRGLSPGHEAARPEVVIVMPCGYEAERAHAEALLHANELAKLGADRVLAVDAAAYFSRPGPRLTDGVELLAHILHPRQVSAAPGRALELERSGAAGAAHPH